MSIIGNMRIADDSFEDVVKEVVKQAGERFDQEGRSPAINALVVFKNSIQHLIQTEFGYLPQSDRETIDSLASFCVSVGILFASSPESLAEVILATKAKGSIMKGEQHNGTDTDTGRAGNHHQLQQG